MHLNLRDLIVFHCGETILTIRKGVTKKMNEILPYSLANNGSQLNQLVYAETLVIYKAGVGKTSQARNDEEKPYAIPMQCKTRKTN